MVGGISLNFASLAKDAGIKGQKSKKKQKRDTQNIESEQKNTLVET